MSTTTNWQMRAKSSTTSLLYSWRANLPDWLGVGYASRGFPGTPLDITQTGGGIELATPAFNGDFSSLVSGGVIYYIQPGTALLEGGTLLHTAGGGPVLGLTGVRTGAPTPIWVTCPTTGGILGTWKFNLYCDGTGTIPFLAGITSAATVPLTGTPADGLTLTIGAGTAVAATDVWKATMAQATDLHGGVYNFTQATASRQPLITKGNNGRLGFLTDGVDDFVVAAGLTIPDPSITPTWEIIFGRIFTPAANGVLVGSDSGFFCTVRVLNTGGIDEFNGNVVNANTQPTSGTFGAIQTLFSASAGDLTQWNSNAPITGSSAGAHAVSAGRAFGATSVGTSPASVEILGALGVNHKPTPTEIASILANAQAWFGY